MVDVDRGLRSDLHAAARHHGRERRAARHPALAALELLRPAVGRQRLLADARRVPAHLRRARRPLRPAPPVHDRPRHLHGLLGRLRAVRLAARAEPRARRAGHRRRDDARDLARADRRRVPRQGARRRVRRLRRRDRRRRRRRPGRRRIDHLGHRLGMDLLRQRADRHRRRLPHAHAGLRVARPERARRRLAGARDVLRLAVPARLRADRGQRKGLGLDADRRLPRSPRSC